MRCKAQSSQRAHQLLDQSGFWTGASHAHGQIQLQQLALPCSIRQTASAFLAGGSYAMEPNV